ncbi:MAG: copper homeostasis protein CutC [Chloroflexota bacterium]
MMKVEICINCDGEQTVTDSVRAAFLGGADTVELCRAMNVAGLTPEMHQMVEARKAFQGKNGLMVMIRPRSGDFCYTKQEIQLMEAQIEMAAEANADGVVLGVLEPKRHALAIDAMQQLLAKCARHPLQVTFHRAFDATPSPLETLAVLIDLGVNRVLTSGTAWGDGKTAVSGIPLLRKILAQAEGKIEVVVGGGVNAQNVGQILAGLSPFHQQVSVHAYSGAQENGVTTAVAVQTLVAAARTFRASSI